MQYFADSTCKIADELDMEASMSNMVIINKIDYLRLVDIAGIGLGVDNPVNIPLVRQAVIVLGSLQALMVFREGGARGERFPFLLNSLRSIISNCLRDIVL
jgi:hypothetical protein